MAKVTGIVKVWINGELVRSKEGATLDMGGHEREMVTGHAVYGYKEKLMPSVLTFTLAHTADYDLGDLQSVVEGTARFECDSGVTYQVTSATVTKTLSVKGGDGEVEVEMQGDPAEAE